MDLKKIACVAALAASSAVRAAPGFSFAEQGVETPRGLLAWHEVIALRLYNRPEQKHVAGVPVRANVRWGAALALCAEGGDGLSLCR